MAQKDKLVFVQPKVPIKIGTFLIFLIWPLLSVYIAFRDYKHQYSRNVFWLFCIFYGYCFCIYENTDSTRYGDEILYWKGLNLNLGEFLVYITTDENSGRFDILQPTITYLVSNFSESVHVLYIFFALIYGFFYSRNVWFLLDQVKQKLKPESLSFLILFSFLTSIWNINGFRFWTATQVFIYGIIQFYYYKKKNAGVFYIILSAFFHDTYVFSIFIFLINLALNSKNKIHIYYYMYMLSFILNNIGSNQIGNLLESLPFGLKDRKGYLNEDYINEIDELKTNTNWYIRYQLLFVQILITASVTWLYYFRRYLINEHKNLFDFFCLGLIFIAFPNFLDYIPSMSRFSYVGYALISVFFFMFFQHLNFKRKPEWYKVTTIFVIATYVFTQLWISMLFSTLATYIGNPFTANYFDLELAMFDVIKGFFK